VLAVESINTRLIRLEIFHQFHHTLIPQFHQLSQ
jgi:hypothetical protein